MMALAPRARPTLAGAPVQAPAEQIDLRAAEPRPGTRPDPVEVPPASSPRREQPPTAGGSELTAIQLTDEQWEWVREMARTRGLAQRHVLFAAVEQHVEELKEYFRTVVQEGDSLFSIRPRPQDVVGEKRSRSLRVPPAERAILDGVIREADAPSMSMYLRIAVYMAMRKAAPSG